MAKSRDAQAQETRRKILENAAVLFSTCDYQKIRMLDIARCAGVSVGTLYLYFHSKSDIVTSFIQERNDILKESLIVDPDVSVTAQYLSYIDRYHNMIKTDGYNFSRAVQLAMIEEKIGHNDTKIDLQEAAIVNLIEHGFSSGELKAENGISSNRFFQMFIYMINGTLVEWLYTGDESKLDTGMELAAQLIRLLQ